MKKLSQERMGEMFIGGEMILYAAFPIILVHSTKLMPPILFAGLSMTVATLVMFFYFVFKGKISTLFNKKAFKYILGVTLFVVIIPSLFIYTGSSQTSGVNTAILLQTEIFFTLLIVGLLTKEKISLSRAIASVLIGIGAMYVLYNGTLKLNLGGLLIVAGTMWYPVGNIYAKKALKLTSSSSILFIRGLFGGIFLMLISLIFENYTNTIGGYIADNIFFVLLNGILIYTISKLLWYEGLKRLDISKSIAMAMTYPAISLIYAYFFLKEIPSNHQLIGFVIMMIGIYVITRESEKIEVVGVD